MDKLTWIKDLVRAEQEMEESGMVDFSAGYDPEASLAPETISFLGDLKSAFVEAASAFNQLKASTIGRIKIYGISKTQADFMLFRNGFKLIFTLESAGKIAVTLSHLGSNFVPGQIAADSMPQKAGNTDMLESQWGAFGNLDWTFKGQPIKMDYLVRYYMSRFIRESTK